MIRDIIFPLYARWTADVYAALVSDPVTAPVGVSAGPIYLAVMNVFSGGGDPLTDRFRRIFIKADLDYYRALVRSGISSQDIIKAYEAALNGGKSR